MSDEETDTNDMIIQLIVYEENYYIDANHYLYWMGV